MRKKGDIADMACKEEASTEQRVEFQQIIADGAQQDSGRTDPAVRLQPEGSYQGGNQGAKRTG